MPAVAAILEEFVIVMQPIALVMVHLLTIAVG